MSKFYQFVQNNSGGRFVVKKDEGICEYVIIEAENCEDANNKAEEIGLYFDGVGDCSCCGDRWRRCDESGGYDTPQLYGEDVYTSKSTFFRSNCAIHFLNGNIEIVELKF